MLDILEKILMSFPAIALTAVVTYYFSQRRYVFEKMQDRKMLYIEEIYSMVVSLEKDLKKYVLTDGSMSGEDYLMKRVKKLKIIQEKFFNLQNFFWEKEIIFEKSSVFVIQKFIDVCIGILSKLQVSNLTIQNSNSKSYDLWLDSYNQMQGELANAKSELMSSFKKTLR